MSLSFRLCRHDEPDFKTCLAIRIEVFVQEQKIPLEEELDAYDAEALHILALCNGEPAGTARLLLKENGRTLKIGRVAVRRALRGQGIGAALMRHAETTQKAARYELEAQIRAQPFYETLGYQAAGPEYDDAGIPHRRMTKRAA